MESLTVRYFAAAADATGVEEETLALDAVGSTVGELRDLLVDRYGAAMARVVANGSFLVDGVVQRDASAPLGSSVDVLPPFSGG
ncbi:MoaD/ThiS family protein [Agromyces bauzanensis]|uniref:Molybdenum cofactor biosynthesis protein D2 (MoaD2) / thiamineS n=1 Tax=Agromyces bauzanensis TaxID=1308924 RepID=A0A917UPJ3_9MICO|nr:MoaD/ThiS family protein [Agromyces bauzanensis]GGJ73192.1 putative molybdenum cofactor biosynthesis protein D2 (MoaD2) / thiamineS [Agromyces bauzanensis]